MCFDADILKGLHTFQETGAALGAYVEPFKTHTSGVEDGFTSNTTGARHGGSELTTGRRVWTFPSTRHNPDSSVDKHKNWMEYI